MTHQQTDQPISVEAILGAYQAEIGALTQRAIIAEAQIRQLQDQLGLHTNQEAEGQQ